MSYTNGLDKPTDYFNTKLYTGDGTAIGSGGHAITGIGFQPDWVWIKARSTTHSHRLFDSVRGINKGLLSNSSNAEQTSTEQLNSFDSDGYTYGSHDSGNENNTTYVAWNWLAGGTASSNTDGSITSSVSANTTAGFSIVSYTGNGTAGATIGHGLSSAPDLVIGKKRSGSANWDVWGNLLGSTNMLNFNKTDGVFNPNGNYHNDTMPTSTVVTLGNDADINGSSATYIMYCFHSVKGYSKIGSYTGNGSSNGSFVYLGFKPAFLIVKRTDSGGYDWLTYDNKRQVTFNVIDDFLKPNLSDAETTGNANQSLDFLSNGVKFRGSGASSNASGGTYIYMAFAESPFVSSSGIPTTAR